MNKAISILAACVLGFFLAKAGAFATGYTAAFAMPTSFVHYMWLWDALVVQFLGFGMLSVLVSYTHSRLFQSNLRTGILIPLSVCQFVLFYPDTYVVYWMHLVVMSASLLAGMYFAGVTQKHA